MHSTHHVITEKRYFSETDIGSLKHYITSVAQVFMKVTVVFFMLFIVYVLSVTYVWC